MNKQKYLEDLRNGIVEVEFKKVSGVSRTMQCTLNENYLPKVSGDFQSNRVRNDDVCNVWSINDGGWRSFRWDSITSWQTATNSLPTITESSADDVE
jgi:hypothetical protein